MLFELLTGLQEILSLQLLHLRKHRGNNIPNGQANFDLSHDSDLPFAVGSHHSSLVVPFGFPKTASALSTSPGDHARAFSQQLVAALSVPGFPTTMNGCISGNTSPLQALQRTEISHEIVLPSTLQLKTAPPKRVTIRKLPGKTDLAHCVPASAGQS